MPASLSIRKLMTATSVALVSLLFASAAEAAHPRHPHRSRASCDAHRPGRSLRQPRSYGGPLATRPQGPAGLLSDPMSRLQRETHPNLGDDDAAIQNDVPPAAPLDVDGPGVPTLRPVGLVSGFLDQQPSSRACSPRSPRGPPVPA